MLSVICFLSVLLVSCHQKLGTEQSLCFSLNQRTATFRVIPGLWILLGLSRDRLRWDGMIFHLSPVIVELPIFESGTAQSSLYIWLCLSLKCWKWAGGLFYSLDRKWRTCFFTFSALSFSVMCVGAHMSFTDSKAPFPTPKVIVALY